MRKEILCDLFFLFQDFLKYSKKANLDTTELEVLETFSLRDMSSFSSELLLLWQSHFPFQIFLRK